MTISMQAVESYQENLIGNISDLSDHQLREADANAGHTI